MLSKPDTTLYISAVVVWELTLLAKLQWVSFDRPLPDVVRRAREAADVEVLGFSTVHAWQQEDMPFFKDHRDPFDRMLIAQALAEGIPIISADEKFDRYGVKRVW